MEYLMEVEHLFDHKKRVTTLSALASTPLPPLPEDILLRTPRIQLKEKEMTKRDFQAQQKLIEHLKSITTAENPYSYLIALNDEPELCFYIKNLPKDYQPRRCKGHEYQWDCDENVAVTEQEVMETLNDPESLENFLREDPEELAKILITELEQGRLMCTPEQLMEIANNPEELPSIVQGPEHYAFIVKETLYRAKLMNARQDLFNKAFANPALYEPTCLPITTRILKRVADEGLDAEKYLDNAALQLVDTLQYPDFINQTADILIAYITASEECADNMLSVGELVHTLVNVLEAFKSIDIYLDVVRILKWLMRNASEERIKPIHGVCQVCYNHLFDSRDSMIIGKTSRLVFEVMRRFDIPPEAIITENIIAALVEVPYTNDTSVLYLVNEILCRSVTFFFTTDPRILARVSECFFGPDEFPILALRVLGNFMQFGDYARYMAENLLEALNGVLERLTSTFDDLPFKYKPDFFILLCRLVIHIPEFVIELPYQAMLGEIFTTFTSGSTHLVRACCDMIAFIYQVRNPACLFEACAEFDIPELINSAIDSADEDVVEQLMALKDLLSSVTEDKAEES